MRGQMSGVPREGQSARSALSEGLQSLPDHDDGVMESLHQATSYPRDDGNILYGENVGEVYGSGQLGTSLPTSFSPAHQQGDFAGSFNIGSYHGHGHMMHHRRRGGVMVCVLCLRWTGIVGLPSCIHACTCAGG